MKHHVIMFNCLLSTEFFGFAIESANCSTMSFNGNHDNFEVVNEDVEELLYVRSLGACQT